MMLQKVETKEIQNKAAIFRRLRELKVFEKWEGILIESKP
jgi:hypothetical protein